MNKEHLKWNQGNGKATNRIKLKSERKRTTKAANVYKKKLFILQLSSIQICQQSKVHEGE